MLRRAFFRLRSLRSRWGGIPAARVLVVILRRHWVAALAILAAMAAFFMTQQYAQNKVLQERERLLPQGGLVEVLVAARDLSAGDVVSPLTVAVRRMPHDWSLPNSMTPLDFDAIHQRSVVKPLKAGHPITTDHLRQSVGASGGLRLEFGFRAVSIPVDEVSSVGGLIQPGDRIDLWSSAIPTANPSEGAIISLAAERSAMPPQARLIAENLLVLATGGQTERPTEAPSPVPRSAAMGGGYSTLTLAVPAAVANLVLGGQLQGRMGVALRAPEASAHARHTASPGAHRGSPGRGPIEILIGGTEGVIR